MTAVDAPASEKQRTEQQLKGGAFDVPSCDNHRTASPKHVPPRRSETPLGGMKAAFGNGNREKENCNETSRDQLWGLVCASSCSGRFPFRRLRSYT